MSLLCGPTLRSWIILLSGVFQRLLLSVLGDDGIRLHAMLSCVDALESSQSVGQGSIFSRIYTGSSKVIQSIEIILLCFTYVLWYRRLTILEAQEGGEV